MGPISTELRLLLKDLFPFFIFGYFIKSNFFEDFIVTIICNWFDVNRFDAMQSTLKCSL